MERDGGDWMRDEATGPAGEEAAAAGAEGYGPQPSWAGPPGTGMARGHGGVPGFSVRMAVAVGLLAAAAGVAVALLLIRGTPVARAAVPATPSASAPAGNGTNLPALPRPSGLSGPSGDGQLQMILTGRVLAVSGTSITVGGAGPAVTAAVTSATKVTGTARGIGGVEVGDEVSAQITGGASHLAATAIQDPAQ
jgi:hypothetical protein